MYTDKIEIDDLKIYVGDSDKVKIIKGEDDVKIIDTTNLIEVYDEKIEIKLELLSIIEIKYVIENL